MSEEEKKAIEYVQTLVNLIKQSQFVTDKGLMLPLGIGTAKSLQILLDFLEKQNEEIDVMADCIAYGGRIHAGEPEKVKEYFRMKATGQIQ